MISQIMRVMSRNDLDDETVRSWDDVRGVAQEASIIMAGDAPKMQPHFEAALTSIVDYAETLSPTYENPPPYK